MIEGLKGNGEGGTIFRELEVGESKGTGYNRIYGLTYRYDVDTDRLG